MLKPIEKAILSALREALTKPVGLVVRTNNAVRLKQAIYDLRAKITDPELKKVQVRFDPENQNHGLYFIHGTEEQGDDGNFYNGGQNSQDY
jgi:hypothetical protein